MNAQFVTALAVTVFVLGAVVWSGITRRRHAHYALVLVFLACLTWAIYEAEQVGTTLTYDGPAAFARTLHFIAVTLTFLAVPFLFVTGLRLARREDPALRAAHRKSAVVFLVLVLVTFGLGSTMTALADTIDEESATSVGD